MNDSNAAVPLLNKKSGSGNTLFSGPFLMIFATLSFTVMVAAVKEVRSEISSFEAMWWRAAFSIPPSFLLGLKAGFRVNRPGTFLLRTLAGATAMACFFTAAKGLPLGNLTAISKLQPVVLAVAAPLFLGRGERAGRAGWFAILLGFAGCAVLVVEDLSGGSRYALWALLGTVLAAAAHLFVRRLGASESPLSIVFWFQVGVLCLSTLAMGFFEGRVVPRLPDGSLWVLMLSGLAATAGQVLMTFAYQRDRASIVAAASYVGPFWGALGDLLVFGVAPTLAFFLGGGLVIAAGLVVIRQAQKDRARERAVAAALVS